MHYLNPKAEIAVNTSPIVSAQEWQAARQELPIRVLIATPISGPR
jgi:hypothetical protein